MGVVRQVDADTSRTRLSFALNSLGEGIAVGASVAINGVCLTAVDVTGDIVTVEVIAESLRRSNLGRLEVGDRVNVERPLAAGGRLDGHIVAGHVDATGEITEVVSEGASRRMRLKLDKEWDRYVVEKGSIAIDGVSLTVAERSPGQLEVALIPHTLSATTLGLRRPGDVVNLEFDVIAKYVERLLENRT